jgi:hypothetical protein
MHVNESDPLYSEYLSIGRDMIKHMGGMSRSIRGIVAHADGQCHTV